MKTTRTRETAGQPRQWALRRLGAALAAEIGEAAHAAATPRGTSPGRGQRL
jgi:hypothetical protein